MPQIRIDCYSACYIDKARPTTNYPNPALLWTGYRYDSEPRMSYVQFVIPNLQGKKIITARMFLYCTKRYSETGGSTTGSATVTPSLITANQNIETVLTNNNTGQYLGSVIKDAFVTEFWFDADGQWKDINAYNVIINNIQGNDFCTIGLASRNTKYITVSGRSATNKAYIIINYEEVAPDVPTLLYPVDTIVENAGELIFKWKYNDYWGSTQTGFKLETKMAIAQVWNSFTINSPDQFYQYDASNFQLGNAAWRLSVKSSNNIYSEVVEGRFSVVGKPRTPIITRMKNSAISEIEWTSSEAEQDVYELTIEDEEENILHDSGLRPSGYESIYRPNLIFKQGIYLVSIRIRSVYDKWSDWGKKQFTLSFEMPEKPTIELSKIDFGIKIMPTFNAEMGFLYRGEEEEEPIPIARVENGAEYIDYTIKSKTLYTYFIRAVATGLADSEEKTIENEWEGYCIATKRKQGEIVNLKRNTSDYFLERGVSNGNNNLLIEYIGREYPALEAGEFLSQQISTKGFLYKGEKKVLDKIFKEQSVTILRSEDESIRCNISGYELLNDFMDRGYTVSLRFARLEYSDEVNIYD